MNRRKVLIGVIGAMLAMALVFTGLVVANFEHISNFLKIAAVSTLVKENYVEEVDTAKLVDGAMKGLVESLEDPYSVYLEPKMFEDLQVQIHGTFGGVGITVGMQEDKLTVISPIKGTPAYKAGIKPGDVISKIEKTDTEGITLEKAVELMRGEPGTKVKIFVVRKGETKPIEYSITREIITVPSVEAEVKEGNIGYIALLDFKETTNDDLVKALEEIKVNELSGLILDLRGNPGGELETAVKVASHFVPKGPVVTIVYRGGKKEVKEATGNNINIPIVVLVNEGSASASEIVAGAVKDTGTGTIVGMKTFGKGVVQSVYPLANGAGLKLTVAKYLTPKGRDIHKKGIQPDVKVEQPAEETEKDLQLEKAMELLKAKIN